MKKNSNNARTKRARNLCTIKQFQWKKWDRSQNSRLNWNIGFELLITSAKNNTQGYSKTQTFLFFLSLFTSRIFFYLLFLTHFTVIFLNIYTCVKKNSIDAHRYTLQLVCTLKQIGRKTCVECSIISFKKSF